MGFEPTGRLLADQTISSRSRYDRFDTAACLIVRSELKKAARKKERIHGEKSSRNASAAYPESLEKSSIFERSLPIRGLDFESCAKVYTAPHFRAAAFTAATPSAARVSGFGFQKLQGSSSLEDFPFLHFFLPDFLPFSEFGKTACKKT